MGKKQFLASCLDKTGMLNLHQLYRKSFPRSGRLTILAYHRIYDFDSKTYLFDEGLISASTEDFDRQMGFIKKNFDVISFSDLKECLDRGRIPKQSLIITFDDGYKDNYDIAYPVLRRYGLPATIFLATGYIGKKDSFWFEKVSYWIKTTKKKSFRLKTDHDYEYYICNNREKVVRSVQTLLKNVNETTHEDLMRQIESQLGISIMDSMPVRTLSWEEVLEMCKGGIEFGSHSVSHLNLAVVSKERLRDEIYASKASLEKALGKSILSMAYPHGGQETFNMCIQNMLREAGYIFGVSYVEGINQMTSFDPFAIQRLHVERDTDVSLFRATLIYPKLFI